MFKKQACAAAIIALGVGFASTAHALPQSFASSILLVKEFKLFEIDAQGNSLGDLSTDVISILDGNNFANTSSNLNLLFGTPGTDTQDVTTGTPTDALQSCVPAGCPVGENDFSTFPTPPPVPGYFSHADQYLDGALITIKDGSGNVLVDAGANASTRSDVSLSATGDGSADADVGTVTTFRFQPLVDIRFNYSLTRESYLLAYVDPTSGLGASAIASLSLAFDIYNNTTNSFLFDEVSARNRSRTGGATGTQGFSETVNLTGIGYDFLAGNDYTLTIRHISAADATLAAVPEPATMGLIGLGLLGIGASLRRRRIK